MSPRSICSHSRGEYEAGNAIDGDDSFDRLLVPVYGEGDALVEKGAGHTLLKSRDLLLGHPLHFVDKELVVRAGLPCGLKGFVKKLRVKLVVAQRVRVQGRRLDCAALQPHHAKPL